MIRLLKPEELSLTREVSEAFFEESGISGALNFDHFCQTWGTLISLDVASIMIYVHGQDNLTLGIIGGTVTPCTMTGDIIAMESFWWVAPFLRGTSPAGLNLLRKWEDWSIERGAKRIYVGNLFRLNDSKMRALYDRLGYSPLEVHYVKSV